MSATSLFPACFQCQHLQDQIDALERNVIAEFRAAADYQNNRSLAPLINRIEALEAQIQFLFKNQPKGG